MVSATDPFTLFADEATESLRTAEACLLALEDGSLDEVNALYRAMHSLKGNARVMGFETT